MVKRLVAGDILQIRTKNGAIYLQFLGKHPIYGDGVAVVPVVLSESTLITEGLFDDAYVTFYPVSAARTQRLATLVGRLPCRGLPQRFRRPGAIEGSRISTWMIGDTNEWIMKRGLTDEEKRLPIAVIWNHEFLVERVCEGWRPEHEG